MAHRAFTDLSKKLQVGSKEPPAPPAAPPSVPAVSPPAAPTDEAAAAEDEPEVTQEPPEEVDPHVRPPKRFKWVEEDDFSVEALLADTAVATLVVFDTAQGAMTITFRLLTEDDKAAAEAQTAPIMNRFYWNEQVNRWVTIAMCAATIVKIDGKEWMKDQPLDKRIAALRKGKSIAMMDRVIGAFHEFQKHTVWLAGELDPKGS